MNIVRKIQFNSDRPAVAPVMETERIKITAIGLLKDQVLAKHKTIVPVMLLVLKGKVEFHINDEHIILSQFDSYRIPLDIEHEVKGIEEENVFTLTIEK